MPRIRTLYNKNYYQLNKQRIQASRKEYNKIWRSENKEKAKLYQRRSELKATYGITLEHYNILVQKQNSQCAICNKQSIRKLCIDHDHKTGKVRGLLCHKCNSGIGLLNDDPNLLRVAVKYLE